MAMLESAETQIAGLWGLASPTRATPSSTPQAPKTSAGKAKPAKFRKQDKGAGKGQQAGRKRQEPPEDEETEDQVLVSRTELRTIRTLLVRHDQALNHLAVDRTYVLFFSTTEMSTLTMHGRSSTSRGNARPHSGRPCLRVCGWNWKPG